jgi:comEA protein
MDGSAGTADRLNPVAASWVKVCGGNTRVKPPQANRFHPKLKEKQSMKKRAWLIIGIAVLCLSIGLAQASGAPGPGKININKAGVEELEKLPRIGPAIAKRIVEYREKNGNFRKIEDIIQVRGIGEKLFLQLKDLITVSDEKEPTQSSKSEK